MLPPGGGGKYAFPLASDDLHPEGAKPAILSLGGSVKVKGA